MAALKIYTLVFVKKNEYFQYSTKNVYVVLLYTGQRRQTGDYNNHNKTRIRMCSNKVIFYTMCFVTQYL